MQYHVNALEELIDKFRQLPGIGGKTAQRLAFCVLDMTQEQAQAFASAIINAKKAIHYCPICQNLTDGDICSICKNNKRDKSVVCVVETPADMFAVEKTQEFTGLYHVLHGTISPMDNIGPGDIRIRELLNRLSSDDIKEIIIATNPTVEGDVTAMYIAKLLNNFDVKITRLAFGIPIGGDLEYTDELTLSKALENRREL
jgi:recombination protein RecR